MSDEYFTPEGRYVRRRLNRALLRDEAATACLPWRWRAAARLRELEKTDGLEEATQQWARVLLSREIKREWAQISPHANPWDPRLLGYLPLLANNAAATALGKAGEDPLLRSMLTAPDAVHIVRENVAAVQNVINDPTIYVLHTLTPDGDPMTVLQHAASGLRGRFAIDPVDGFGYIYSKPYHVPSINPDDPHDNGMRWERYARLGIGRRLYLAAADLHPHARWRMTVTSSHAQPLRSRLHNADPHRWAARCNWCQTRRITWRGASPADFAQHPITPAPAALVPQLIVV